MVPVLLPDSLSLCPVKDEMGGGGTRETVWRQMAVAR